MRVCHHHTGRGKSGATQTVDGVSWINMSSSKSVKKWTTGQGAEGELLPKPHSPLHAGRLENVRNAEKAGQLLGMAMATSLGATC